MYGNGSFVSELLLRLVYLSDEIDERFGTARHTVLGPVRELKLTNRTRLTILPTASV